MAQAVSPEDAQNWLDAFNGGKGDGAAAPALEPAAAAMPEPAAPEEASIFDADQDM